MKKLTLTLIALGTLVTSLFSQTVPDKPTRYFNDTLGLVSAAKATQFNEQLAQFERDTSNQFLVCIYPRSYIENQDVAKYGVDLANKWQVGQHDKRNGLILFAFLDSQRHGKLNIQVGYGLEGAITDYQSKQVINHMSSYFKNHDYDTAFTVAINELIKASVKEHKGTGKTDAENPSQIVKEKSNGITGVGIVIFSAFIFIGLLITGIYLFINRKRREEEEKKRQEEAWAQHIAKKPAFIPSKHRRPPMPPPPAPHRPVRESTYVPVPISISSPSRDDDDDDTSRSSSSNDDDSSSSSSSFESGAEILGAVAQAVTFKLDKE
jgi:uncharacterized protein